MPPTALRRPVILLRFIVTLGAGLLPVILLLMGAAAGKAVAAPPMRPLTVPDNPVTEPLSNTIAVPITTTISIVYDETISPTTVTTTTFAVQALQTGLLTQTISVNGGVITLTPPASLKPGELVYVSATTGTLNFSGQGPARPTVWQFRAQTAAGSGFFIDSGQRLYTTNSWAAALGDLDGDGDLDAFLANDAPNEVWLNNGAGLFTTTHQALANLPTEVAALGDLDGDGDLDAFVGNNSVNPNQVWLNDGRGNFTDSRQTLGNSYTTDLALGDLDGDGDLDAFTANYGSQANRVWLNDGRGIFTDTGQTLGISTSLGIDLGDLDGDGDLDAFVANGLNERNVVWFNNGRALFTQSAQLLGIAGTRDVALGDVNGDRALDAFIVNTLGEPSEVWLNDGTGNFTDTGQRLANGWALKARLGDLDADGDLDAFIINETTDLPNKVWLNNGAGSFTDSGQLLGNSNSRAMDLGDLDGDGSLDAFVANVSPQPGKVWFNTFRLTKHAPKKNGRQVTAADVFSATLTTPLDSSTINSDTLVIRGEFTGHYVGIYTDSVQFKATSLFKPGETIYLSLTKNLRDTTGTPLYPHTWQVRNTALTGSGVFTAGAGLSNLKIGGISLADLNGDSHLDIFIAARSGVANQVWLNDGDGNFTDTGQRLGSADSEAVALGDLDGDGDIDALTGNEVDDQTGVDNQVWLNDGQGNFETGSMLSVEYQQDTMAVKLGDLDGDGDLDAFIGNWNNQTNEVWFNDGQGNFTDSGQRLRIEDSGAHTVALALGDLDGDGDLDAYAANWNFQPDQIWFNNGEGIFYDSGQRLGATDSQHVALGDVDGDGDLDAMVANQGAAPNLLWLNDGDGNFTDSGQQLGNSHSEGVELGDLDGDGDLDAFVANEKPRDGSADGDANRVWYNNGQGQFSVGTQALGLFNSLTMAALGDVNGDGTLDAVVGNSDHPSQVWLNRSFEVIYMPLLHKPASVTFNIKTAANTGGVYAEVRHPNTDELLLSCTIANDTTALCGKFAPIGQYKFIARPNNCAENSGLFDDAASGAIITREISCPE